MQNVIVFIYQRKITKNECCKAFYIVQEQMFGKKSQKLCTSNKYIGEDVYRNISKVVKFTNTLSVEKAMLD